MKVTLIGNESELSKHLSFWESIPAVQVEQSIVVNEDNLDSLPSFSYQSELIDVCASTEWKPFILKRLGRKIPIIVESPIASSIRETKHLLNFIKEEQMMIRIVNPLMTSPEWMNLNQRFTTHQLGNSGVNRISSKSEVVPGDDRFLEQELHVIDWIYRTFGDFNTIFAKKVDSRYMTVHIRHKDNSFTHLELARGFGKEELNIELAGSKGMLTHKSNETNPISIAKIDMSKRKVNPIGTSLIQRQLEDVHHILTKDHHSFNNITEVTETIDFIEAIESSFNQAIPVTKGGA
ncbi:Predicted dehydrogenase [Gracilibacillus orientalis]|uniref:Predicted dehydrogenase n=1 Tax=Gracilibacillus orientalis TaxID=334253 RepID=A0A1I4JRE4_9BACI|nr:hypothetical protein [Gracilibacillus orientalis]SFL69129.1 Predicted dehydrogenase [Gracilibacillus orientalis]